VGSLTERGKNGTSYGTSYQIEGKVSSAVGTIRLRRLEVGHQESAEWGNGRLEDRNWLIMRNGDFPGGHVYATGDKQSDSS
jgi:hypothetical protein